MQVDGDGVITRLRQLIDDLNFNKIVSDTLVAQLLQTNEELSSKIIELENTIESLKKNYETGRKETEETIQ